MVASDISHDGSTNAAAATTANASAPSKVLRQAISDLPWLRPGEQPIGPEHQYQRHHGVNDEQLELRHEMHRGGATDGADERAFDRSQSPDDDHREGKHDHLDADAERDRNLRRHHGAAERPQDGAEHEGHRVDDADVDAEGGGELA